MAQEDMEDLMTFYPQNQEVKTHYLRRVTVDQEHMEDPMKLYLENLKNQKVETHDLFYGGVVIAIGSMIVYKYLGRMESLYRRKDEVYIRKFRDPNDFWETFRDRYTDMEHLNDRGNFVKKYNTDLQLLTKEALIDQVNDRDELVKALSDLGLKQQDNFEYHTLATQRTFWAKVILTLSAGCSALGYWNSDQYVIEKVSDLTCALSGMLCSAPEDGSL